MMLCWTGGAGCVCRHRAAWLGGLRRAFCEYCCVFRGVVVEGSGGVLVQQLLMGGFRIEAQRRYDGGGVEWRVCGM